MLTSGKVNKHPTKTYFFTIKTLLQCQKVMSKISKNMLITFVDK